MSERSSARQQCELKLKAASGLCQASLNVLNNISGSPSSTSEPDLAKIHADLLSLLSLIYHITTKLALALNPTEPTFPAAISSLDDLVQHVNAITSCASLFVTAFGSTLRMEVLGLTSDVLQTTKSFVDHCVLITDGVTPPPKLKAAHLYLTGSLHELIDHSRGSDGLSKDNLQAVRKKWSQNRSVLEDGYRELSELLTSDGTDDGFLNEDFDDENGLVLDSAPLTAEEAERVEKVQRYIRVTNLLHERVYVDLLKPSALKIASSLPDFVSTLDEISRQSARFVSATDEIISCLHSPQDPKAISVSLQKLGEVVATIQRLLNQGGFLPKPKGEGLESQMESMTAQAFEADQKKAEDTRKWFDTCLAQVEKLQISLVCRI
ncbi:hypothetical protein BDM02DRAFT_3108250 [Thelephora ganbajun]|uniref:Uncharacterized protein n=1 Tax=Thelephora ganbajun TaxID=370292 RepID=A0ACB6ZUK7_THEGA|nr:hypothetical protein BDM02DRAFT_3108250 [Thelephora ganbajun]